MPVRFAARRDAGRASSLDSRLLIGFGLVLLTALVRLIPAWNLGNDVFDIVTYRVMGTIVLHGDNVYLPRLLFPYLPFSQFIPAYSVLLANATGWPFDFAVKLPCIVADAATTALLFGYFMWRGLAVSRAAGWCLAWALNPVSILISAFHGNLMAIVPSLVVGAFVAAQVAENSSNRNLLLAAAALLLGVAIGIRTYPILLVPVFLVLMTRTVKETFWFAFFVALPGGLSAIPYLIYARESFLNEVLSYSGVSQFGWVSVLRTVVHLLGGPKLSSTFEPGIIQSSKPVFAFAYILITATLPFFRPSSFGRALLLAPLLFYGVYAGVSSQYLVWVLPVAIIARERLCLPYAVAATSGLIAYYTLEIPAALFGRYGSPPLDERFLTAVAAGSNGLLEVVSLAWIAIIVMGELRAYRAGRWWTSVTWVRRFRALWSSRVYAGAVLALYCAWLLQLGRTITGAQQMVRGLLP